jgi:hypothetical protein
LVPGSNRSRLVSSYRPANCSRFISGYLNRIASSRRLEPEAQRRRLLPEANVRRFRNRLRGLRDRWQAGSVDLEEVRIRVSAWIAHAAWADSRGLRRAIFKGGMFDPDLKPDRSHAGARCARRVVEQQSVKPPRGDPQQEPTRQPEQQSGVSGGQHASMPEFAGSRTCGARG